MDSTKKQKPKSKICEKCGKFCSAKYLKDHGMCGKCYTTIIVNYDELKKLNILTKKINDLCFDVTELKQSYTDKLFKLNLLIDELIIDEIRQNS